MKPNEIYSHETVNDKLPAADKDFEGTEIEKGGIVEITTFYVADITTANKTMRIGYKRGGNTFWLVRKAAGGSTYHINLDRPLILVEEETPVARIETATDQDTGIMIVRGKYL